MNNRKPQIREKILSLATECGHPDAALDDGAIIPQTGLLNSRAIIELVVWLEDTFDLDLDEDQITVENLGSVNAIAGFLARELG